VNESVRQIHARLLRERERERGILVSFENEGEILGSFERKGRPRETESCYSPLREREMLDFLERDREKERDARILGERERYAMLL